MSELNAALTLGFVTSIGLLCDYKWDSNIQQLNNNRNMHTSVDGNNAPEVSPKKDVGSWLGGARTHTLTNKIAFTSLFLKDSSFFL